MSDYFLANGFVPRTLGQTQGSQQLLSWLTQSVSSGRFRGRSAMSPSPWRWTQRVQPSQAMLRPAPTDGRTIIRDVEQKLFNLMQIPISSGGRSRGYVTSRDIHEMREQREVLRGQPGGPFNPGQPERAEHFVFWDVVRRLPDTDQEAAQWGYSFSNLTAREVIMRECRRYNTTLRARLVAGSSAGRAHADAVRQMRQQSIQLIFQAGFQLAIAVGSSGAMNFAPSIGDFAAVGSARLHGR